MPYCTSEAIEKAKEIDLYTYLKNFEPHELVRFSRNTYTTRTHDSLKISNGKWMWWSRGIGGKTALQYLIKVKGIEFTEAVIMIVGRDYVADSYANYKKQLNQEKRLLLPEKHTNCGKVTEYLFSRGIDFEIISYCISEGLIYESLPNHNVIFVGFDEQSKPRYAAYRSIDSKRFMGDATGSNKNYSFRLTESNSNTVHVFESAIDLLSYATLLKLEGKDWKGENLLSLAGVYGPQSDIAKSKVPKALENFLSANKQIREVHFHLDNDFAGKNATEAITLALPKEIKAVSKPPPRGKDYNDYLCVTLGLFKEKNERNVENER